MNQHYLCEVGYMHMNDSDFQTLGAASILTKKKFLNGKGKQKRNGMDIIFLKRQKRRQALSFGN